MVSAEPGPETSDAGPAAVPAQGSPPDATPQAVPADAQAAPAADAKPAASPRRLRKGRLLLILGIVVLSLFVVGGVAGLIVYNEATKIDRSTPTVVVRQFLQAALVDKDAAVVGLFVCGKWSSGQAMAAADLNLDPAIVVAWGVTSEQIDGGKARVVARVTFSLTGSGVSQRSVESWAFDAVQEDGWRVCSLSRSPLLDP